MSPATVIGMIGTLLTMCGITSIRMFLPTFLYYMTLRIAQGHPEHLPELVNNFAKSAPSWQLSWPFLTVMGILAAAEMVAIRNAEVKRFMVEDLDRYAKPIMTALYSFGFVSPLYMEQTQQMLNDSATAAAEMQASILGCSIAVVVALAAGALTGLCCKIREYILKFIYMIDPNNSFYLQTIANNAGEFILVSLFVLMILLPALALFMMLMGMAAALFIKILAKFLDKKHECPACLEKGVKTKVCDSASICQKCGSPQPNIRKVGLFGFPSSAKLGNTPPQKHALKLLSARRCRWCATPLATGKALCGECGRPQWDDQLLKAYLKKTDIWFYVLTGLGVVLSTLPFGPLPLLIFYSLFVIRPLEIHMRRGSRFLVSLLMNMVKIVAIILGLILSSFPGVSFLILVPFIVRYLLIRKGFVRQFRTPVDGGQKSAAAPAKQTPAKQTPAKPAAPAKPATPAALATPAKPAAPEKPAEQTPAASLPAPEPAAETSEPAPKGDAEKAATTAPEGGSAEIAVSGDSEPGKDAPSAK